MFLVIVSNATNLLTYREGFVEGVNGGGHWSRCLFNGTLSDS